LTVAPVSFEKDKSDLGRDYSVLRSLVNKPIDYNVVIVHLTPEHYERFIEDDKFNIGYTVWETNKLHPTWPDYVNKMGAVMVACDWNVDVFKECGVDIPIFKVPHGIDIAEYGNIRPYTIKGVDKDAYIFYNINQFTERKNIPLLLKSYWSAFCNNENVALVLKTYILDSSAEDKERIRNIISVLKSSLVLDNYPPVYFIHGMLDRDEILGLHKTGNCLVSLDRGEGFSLTPFEAGAIGNPIIVTGIGGVLEYAKQDNSYLVDCNLEPVFNMNWCPWYKGDQMWATPNSGQAINFMKEVYNNRVAATERSTKLKKFIFDNLKWEDTSKIIVDAINSI